MNKVIRRLNCDKCKKKVAATSKLGDERFYCTICGRNLGIHTIRNLSSPQETGSGKAILPAQTSEIDSLGVPRKEQSPENNSLEEQVSIGDDGLSLVGKASISDEEPIYKPKTLPAPKDEELCRCKHRKEDHLEEAGECRHYTELTPPKKYAGYSCSCKEYTPQTKPSIDNKISTSDVKNMTGDNTAEVHYPHTNRDEPGKKEFESAVFEMLQIFDEKITNLINRFDRLAKELGYKV